MLFQIKRTSKHYSECPCEEAVKGKLLRVDVRTVDNPEKLLCMTSEEWYSQGSNHRMINNQIARNLNMIDCYLIEINSLENLISLKDKYGKIIIGESCIDRTTPLLEIYDSDG